MGVYNEERSAVRAVLDPQHLYRMVFHFLFPQIRTHVSRGFTLLELMVVTGIFMVLSSVVLSSNGRFGNQIVLQNLAHDMALTIRQAQVYGIAVRRFEGANFDVAYGMHFILPAPDAPSTYELFADADSDGVYDYDAGETVNTTTIGGGYRIVDIQVLDGNGVENLGVGEVNILFQRPEPDALIRRSAGEALNQRVKIVLESRRGNQSTVIVEASGQISVQ